MLMVAVAVVILLAYFGWQYARAQELLKNPAAAAIEETNNLVREVGRLVMIPKDETPTVATVSDKSKLAGQPFFLRAEEGDKVLIFAKEGRAILYRPNARRVVEMTSVTAPSPTPEAQLLEANLSIYNGTETQGLAGVAEKKIGENLKGFKVVEKRNSQGAYPKTVLVVLNSQAKMLADQLASLIKAEIVNQIPAGEEKPASDLLLILGNNYSI